MEELLQKLQNEHGLNSGQSYGILNTITNYVKEKFPMVAGAIDNIFPQNPNASSVTETENAGINTSESGSPLDKISDFIPGSTGEKIEEFAKDKLGNFFGGNKSV